MKETLENRTMEKQDWERIFSDTYSISKSTRIRSEYIRFNHLIIYSQNRLYNMRLVRTRKCKICNADVCDREHLLTTCMNADFVWKELEKRLQPLFLGIIKGTEKMYGASEEDDSLEGKRTLYY